MGMISGHKYLYRFIIRNLFFVCIRTVNCLAPFALTLLLLPECMLSKSPKIVYISSSSHIRGGPFKAGSVKSMKSNVVGVKETLQSYAVSK